MSKESKRRAQAEMFRALGDPTRLWLVTRLAEGERRSIAELTAETRLTRQAVTKHLHMLERVRLIHGHAEGRERRYAIDPQPLEEMRAYLERVSGHWDRALGRLKTMVEEG